MNTREKPITVFVSHSRSETSFARRLSRSLTENGIRVWFDEYEIKIGDSIIETINHGISEADALLIIASKNKASKWSHYELNSIISKDPTTGQHKPIIPILLPQSELPGFLSQFKGVSFTKDFDDALQELVEGLRQRFPDAPVYSPQKRSLPSKSKLSFGRVKEIGQINDLLENHIAVLINGLAGIGKTTLAVRWADWAKKANFAEDIVWLSCGPLTEAAFIADLEKQLSVIASSDSQEARIKAIIESLNSKRTVIVLDDVSDQTSVVVSHLISGMSQSQSISRILLTSRVLLSELNKKDIAVLQLSALSHEESIALLEQLLTQYGKSLNSTELKKVISWTQGIPLAIHLVSNLIRQGHSIDEIQSTSDSFSEQDPSTTLARSLQFGYDCLLIDEKETLGMIALFDCPVTPRTVATVMGMLDVKEVELRVHKLSSFGLISLENDRITIHPLVRKLVMQQNAKVSTPKESGTLYIMLDPTLMSKEDFVEVLDILNETYTCLGGDELVIREDDVGRFSKVGVPA